MQLPQAPSAKQSPVQEAKPYEVFQVADAIALSEFAPPFVVVDGADNIVYFRGDTNRYLKLPEGKATMNVVELARPGLASHVDLAIRSARRQKAQARRDNITYADTADAPAVDILVRPVLTQGRTEECLMVVFKESSRRETLDGKTRKRGKAPEKDRRFLELEHELKRTREDLQASMEEMETSNEELKSANEELLSSNEELQSTNEELETSREELRSLNEELSGLNVENQERIEQLNRARDEMRNLLDTTDLATVFLDSDLNILGSTPALNRLFRIRKSDIGRPLGEISTVLDYDGLIEDIRSVLHDLGKVEKEVRTKDNRWYLMRVVPFRSVENEIRGVVITFMDIDARRILEAALRYTQNIVDTVREPMLVLDKDLHVLSGNRSFYSVFHTVEEDTVGKFVYDLGNRQWDIPVLRNLMEEIIPQNEQFNNYPVEHDFPLIGRRRMLLNARRLYDELGSQRVLLAIEDVTEQPFTDALFPPPGGGESHGRKGEG
jgi:two-component system CheB/CheR fusion protein